MSENATMSHFLPASGTENGTQDTRGRFLQAFSSTFGNVSASCEYAGISRRTYYRWIKSISRVNRDFQRRIKEIRPQERQLDLAEAKLLERLNAGDWKAIEFVLKSRGRKRGYIMHETDDGLKTSDVAKVATAFRHWLDKYPGASTVEIHKWLVYFSEGSGMEVADLAGELGIEKLMAKRLGR